ncbi:hypothetical protein XNA1_2440016 [Xenorhabdus nematophila str. Anatoliense]|nr:hypothetical protein XNA1_2440016 [Xenorhabdus nematophila str. Anatoliense]
MLGLFHSGNMDVAVEEKKGKNTRKMKQWCEGGDLNPHVRKDTNT